MIPPTNTNADKNSTCLLLGSFMFYKIARFALWVNFFCDSTCIKEKQTPDATTTLINHFSKFVKP